MSLLLLFPAVGGSTNVSVDVTPRTFGLTAQPASVVTTSPMTVNVGTGALTLVANAVSVSLASSVSVVVGPATFQVAAREPSLRLDARPPTSASSVVWTPQGPVVRGDGRVDMGVPVWVASGLDTALALDAKMTMSPALVNMAAMAAGVTTGEVAGVRSLARRRARRRRV